MRNVIYIGQEKYRGMYNTAEILLLGNNIDDTVLDEAKKKSQLPRYGKHAIYFRYNGIPERSNAYAL